MAYLLVILIGIGVIWAIYYFSNKAEKKEKPKVEKIEQLKIHMNNYIDPGKEDGHKAENSKESLDELYAKSHGKWCCRHCETINDEYAQSCAACGYKKR